MAILQVGERETTGGQLYAPSLAARPGSLI